MIKAALLLKWIAFCLATANLLFTVTEYYGFWDNIRCTSQLRRVSSEIGLSYQGTKHTYHQQDTQWNCLIDLIRKQSDIKLPENKEPKTITRSVAVTSAQKIISPNQIAEWTAPSTPILVIFEIWPNNKLKFGPEDYVIVGTIGDLSNWIEKDKNNFKFRIQNNFFGFFAMIIAIILLLNESFVKRKQSAGSSR